MGTMVLWESRYPQTVLAYEMDADPLFAAQGAPLRLRIETKLGLKMVKWIELVEDYRTAGEGWGGYREGCQYHGTGAEI